MLTRVLCVVSCILILAGASFSPAFPSETKAEGFLTRRGTELLLDGKPFRAVSLNKADLFWHCLEGDAETQQELDAIKKIAEHDFRVIRFGAIGFYPKAMNLWADAKYWERMDKIFAEARKYGVKLVPVLIWNWYLFPDMSKETVQDMLTDRDSKSRQYSDLYVSQVVSRYKDDPNVLYWEITNELNLNADLEFLRPYGYSHLNAVDEGCPPMRVRLDNYTTEQMISFLRETARLIRRIDPNHLISSGHSVPYPAAQHLRLAKVKGDWTEDTPEEAATYIRDVNPDPIDLISIHFYSGHDNIRFGNKDNDSAVALRQIKQICDKVGKPVIIGEFGGQAFDRDSTGGCPAFTRSVVKEAVDADYPIILYWMNGGEDALKFDLDKTTELNKLLFDADKKLVENATRKD
ncbi:MAG: glycoside hydrolase family 5 protein [Armatimonadetes bacterium]|nr:glycoside hydrolase family 5 protein [Armatimonadota bacterium]